MTEELIDIALNEMTELAKTYRHRQDSARTSDPKKADLLGAVAEGLQTAQAVIKRLADEHTGSTTYAQDNLADAWEKQLTEATERIWDELHRYIEYGETKKAHDAADRLPYFVTLLTQVRFIQGKMSNVFSQFYERKAK